MVDRMHDSGITAKTEIDQTKSANDSPFVSASAIDG